MKPLGLGISLSRLTLGSASSGAVGLQAKIRDLLQHQTYRAWYDFTDLTKMHVSVNNPNFTIADDPTTAYQVGRILGQFGDEPDMVTDPTTDTQQRPLWDATFWDRRGLWFQSAQNDETGFPMPANMPEAVDVFIVFRPAVSSYILFRDGDDATGTAHGQGFQDGFGSTVVNDGGDSYVNNALTSPANWGAAYSQAPQEELNILESRGAQISGWSKFTLGNYTGREYGGLIAGVVITSPLSAQKRTQLYSLLAQYYPLRTFERFNLDAGGYETAPGITANATGLSAGEFAPVFFPLDADRTAVADAPLTGLVNRGGTMVTSNVTMDDPLFLYSEASNSASNGVADFAQAHFVFLPGSYRRTNGLTITVDVNTASAATLPPDRSTEGMDQRVRVWSRPVGGDNTDWAVVGDFGVAPRTLGDQFDLSLDIPPGAACELALTLEISAMLDGGTPSFSAHGDIGIDNIRISQDPNWPTM